MDYDLRFTDKTLIEGEGEFDKVAKIMLEEDNVVDWMLRTNLQMLITTHNQLLEAQFVLHFYSDGTIYISEYIPSGGQHSFYNPDISGLVTWSLESGWKAITPANDLVKDNQHFWKYCWETNLVKSDYLKDQYGEIKENNMP